MRAEVRDGDEQRATRLEQRIVLCLAEKKSDSGMEYIGPEETSELMTIKRRQDKTSSLARLARHGSAAARAHV